MVDRHGMADCRHWEYSCTPPMVAKLATYSGGAFIIVYFFAYVYYLHRGFRLLRSRPYAGFRVGNVLLRVQVCGPPTARRSRLKQLCLMTRSRLRRLSCRDLQNVSAKPEISSCPQLFAKEACRHSMHGACFVMLVI